MTDGDALKRAVIANPDDDTPRLIYADWLDENRQPDRAAFIRAQIEAARAEPFGSQARTAETKANLLLERHRLNWTQHLYGHFLQSPGFHRGFIDHLAVEPTAFVAATAMIFAAEPIRSLQIIRSGDINDWALLLPVFNLPQLKQLRQLELTCHTGLLDEEYTGLTESPCLSGIQKLSLRGSLIHPPWLAEMLSGNAFPELIGLDIANITNLGTGLLDAVSRTVHRELKHLDAFDVRFTSNQLQQILSSPCLQNVEELRFGFAGRAGEMGPLRHLDIGWVIPWKRLVVLDLAGQRLGDDAVHEITSQEEARTLRWLRLSNNDLGSDSIRLLIKSKHLDLKYLDLRGNAFTSHAVVALQERFPDALIVR